MQSFDLTEFLKIDTRKIESIDLIFSQTIAYLDYVKKNRYAYELMLPIKGIINKFASCAEYYGVSAASLLPLVSDFVQIANEQSTYTTAPTSFIAKWTQKVSNIFYKKRRLITDDSILIALDDQFQKLYNGIIITYNILTIGDALPPDQTNEINLNGFFNPDNANKITARKLIVDAIEFIQSDHILTSKTKQSIGNYLNNALVEFDKDMSNWTIIFGSLKETIFVLGALGSLARGVTNDLAIVKAKNKLEEATLVIEKTAVHINYHTMNSIFQLEEGMIMIEETKPKLLVEPINI